METRGTLRHVSALPELSCGTLKPPDRERYRQELSYGDSYEHGEKPHPSPALLIDRWQERGAGAALAY